MQLSKSTQLLKIPINPMYGEPIADIKHNYH